MQKEHLVYWMPYVKSLSQNSILHEKELVICYKVDFDYVYTADLFNAMDYFFQNDAQVKWWTSFLRVKWRERYLDVKSSIFLSYVFLTSFSEMLSIL